jgi:hypothetical protein
MAGTVIADTGTALGTTGATLTTMPITITAIITTQTTITPTITMVGDMAGVTAAGDGDVVDTATGVEVRDTSIRETALRTTRPILRTTTRTP